MKFFVNEIFQSIQGEGLFVGKAMNFIRFTNCNLKCNWCDTDFEKGKEMEIDEIITKLDKNMGWVSLTGGEPMLEENLEYIIKKLKQKKFKIFLETNGTIFERKIFDESDFLSIDIKPPSSGNAEFSRKVFSYVMKNQKKTQLKVVVKDNKDVKFFTEIYEKNKSYGSWILQPEWSAMKELKYHGLMKKFPNARIIPQIHKLLKIK